MDSGPKAAPETSSVALENLPVLLCLSFPICPMERIPTTPKDGGKDSIKGD